MSQDTKQRWFTDRKVIAWLSMVSAVGIHVFDEAMTGFLPFYNELVIELRTRLGFFPAPSVLVSSLDSRAYWRGYTWLCDDTSGPSWRQSHSSYHNRLRNYHDNECPWTSPRIDLFGQNSPRYVEFPIPAIVSFICRC